MNVESLRFVGTDELVDFLDAFLAGCLPSSRGEGRVLGVVGRKEEILEGFALEVCIGLRLSGALCRDSPAEDQDGQQESQFHDVSTEQPYLCTDDVPVRDLKRK